MTEVLTRGRGPKAGWRTVKFGDVVRLCKEKVDRDNNPFERYVEGGHMGSEDVHIRRWGEFGEDYVGPAFHRIFRKGQILYGSRRTYLKKVAVAEFDGITANTTFVLETKDQSVFMQELLPFLMLTDKFAEHSIKESKGSTNPYINWPDIAKFEFSIPPIEEQKLIAEILWAADEAVERYMFALKQHEALTKVFLARELWSGESATKLLDYCNQDGIKIGPFGSLLHASDYNTEGVPVVMPSNIAQGKIVEDAIARVDERKASELSSYRLRENDVVFPRRGDLSKRALVPKHQEGWLCGTGTIRVRLRQDVHPKAIFYALTSQFTNSWLDRFSVGTTMPNLNASTVSKIPLRVPSSERCEQIVLIAEKAQMNIESARNHIVLLLETKRRLAETIILGESGVV